MKAFQRYHIEIEIDASVFEEQRRAKEIAHVRNREVAQVLLALRLVQSCQGRASVDLLLVEMTEVNVLVLPQVNVRAALQVNVSAVHEYEDVTVGMKPCCRLDRTGVPSENIVILRRLNEEDLQLALNQRRLVRGEIFECNSTIGIVSEILLLERLTVEIHREDVHHTVDARLR